MDRIAFPVVCFCDIPLGRISEHVGFYGKYGLGMSRTWALENNLNPVFYISPAAPLGESFITTITSGLRSDRTENEEDKKVTEHLKFMLAHTKPLSGKMIRRGDTTERDFYLENEWRRVPDIAGIPLALVEESYENAERRSGYDASLREQAALEFAPEDVRYLFVETDNDIPHLVDFINTALTRFSSDSLKILNTRIISLEHIGKDV